jgi:uncharacterized repeat protein (TIGR03806 family)
MSSVVRSLAAIFVAAMCRALAAAEEPGPVHFDPAAPPARQISEYYFFKDAAHQIPNDGVIPYDINSPLFSDYTSKHRFVYLPQGAAAEYDPRDPFSFPVGSVLIKTFGYLHDIRDASKGERIIETRLLMHTSDGWVGQPYLWNADTTEATLKVAGTTVDVEWTHFDGATRTNNYIVPNSNQCKACHEQAGKLMPLGPKARNLNVDFAYTGGTENQLVHWSTLGILHGAPADPAQAPRLAHWPDPSTGSLDARARAYLENNCMHCHNPKGPGNTTGLDLTFDQRDPLKFGVMKPPVAAGRGAGHAFFDLVPGKPDESILLFRLASTDPGIMMPELPRRLVDDEAVAMLREWILSMKDDGTAPGQD